MEQASKPVGRPTRAHIGKRKAPEGACSLEVGARNLAQVVHRVVGVSITKELGEHLDAHAVHVVLVVEVGNGQVVAIALEDCKQRVEVAVLAGVVAGNGIGLTKVLHGGDLLAFDEYSITQIRRKVKLRND